MNESKTNISFKMTDDEFIDYTMQMHFMTYDQKLIYLKHPSKRLCKTKFYKYFNERTGRKAK